MPRNEDTGVVGVRLGHLRRELQQVAEREDRTLSQQARRYIREGIKRDRERDRER